MSATGTWRDRTPWRATQRVAWEALKKWHAEREGAMRASFSIVRCLLMTAAATVLIGCTSVSPDSGAVGTPTAAPVGSQTAAPVDRRIPFTAQLREQWKFTDDEIKSLQFYVHDTVLLSREATEGNRVARGKLVASSGRYEIELPAGTPGVAVRVEPNRLWLCFETDCSATLMFSCANDGCIKGWDGKYNSLVRAYSGVEEEVDYGGATYLMKPTTYIEIDEDALAKVQIERRVLPGKRLNDARDCKLSRTSSLICPDIK